MLFNELFGNYLIQKKVLKENVIKEYILKSDTNHNALQIELSKARLVNDEILYRHLADFCLLKYRFMQISEVDLDLVKKYPLEKMIELRVLPIEDNEEEITFLIGNIFRIEDIGQFKYLNNKKLNYVITPSAQMDKLLEYVTNKIQQKEVLSDYSSTDSDITEADPQGEVSIDAPVIKLCDSILKEAVSRGASDIHIEPYENKLVLRYRLDGSLKKMDDIPIHLYPAILARIKIMAEMNIAERRIPQDGKITLDINNLSYDFRVSTLPTLHGEKIVIRIYNVSFVSGDISTLGFTSDQQKLVLDMINRPHGIILLTGPTGSGKSTTLYTFLRHLNKEDTNIITVEDPVENEIPGIAQVQVNPKANLTFATALRAILRQDPNIIMIGEIRDEETAQIATRAAITGHLVLSSIHTNDVASVVTRLINMGIPRYLVADSLLGAISQRLVKKLCPKCKRRKKTTFMDMEVLKINEPKRIFEANGCPYCNNTGYLGRIGVFEIMVLNDEIRNFIMSNEYTSEGLNVLLKKNMMTLLDHVRLRILNGETSIEEFEKLNDVVDIKGLEENQD